MSKIGIIQPHFFPWLGFYCLLKEIDILVWLDDVQIAEKAFQNRVQVNTSKGTKWINIPFQKKIPRDKRIFKDLETLEDSNWRKKNLDILFDGYKKTNNFEIIKKIYLDTVKKDKFLEILISSCSKPAAILNVMPSKIYFSSDLKIKSKSSDRVLKIIKNFGATTYVTGHGSLNYLDHEKLEKNNIKINYLNYKLNKWTQPKNYLFPYVSILDFISCASDIKNYQLNYDLIYWKNMKNLKIK